MALERDELNLNRVFIPFVPAEAGTQFFGRVLGPGSPLPRGRTELAKWRCKSKFIPLSLRQRAIRSCGERCSTSTPSDRNVRVTRVES